MKGEGNASAESVMFNITAIYDGMSWLMEKTNYFIFSLIIKTHLQNKSRRDTAELALRHAHSGSRTVAIKECSLQAQPFREIPRQGRDQHTREIREALQVLKGAAPSLIERISRL